MKFLTLFLSLTVLATGLPGIAGQRNRGDRGNRGGDRGERGRGWGPRWGARGDPLFSGFDGSSFFFTGQPNKTYNILSTESCQLNAYFVDAELELGSHLAKAMGGGGASTAPNGTFIQTFAFQYGSQSIVAEVDRQGKLTSLKVNGANILTATDTMFELRLPNDVTMEYQKFRPWYGQSVNISSPDFDMIWYPTLAHQDESDANVRGHLNAHVVAVHITGDEVNYVHGVLGQTLRSATPAILGGGTGNQANVTDATKQTRVTKFRGQGSESDYQVSGLFDRDFAFNQLANHEPVLKAISRRRQARKMA